ncbi:MAG TPA: signal peptidase I [Marmoricola sp.]|nr:signal peptidase I [Marmoricola sp.]
MTSGFQALGRWTARLLALAMAAAVAAAVVVLVALPRLTHGQAMTVLSGSMTPGIPVGSVVVVRPIDPADLHVGDVATYQAVPGKPVFVTHRVVGIDHADGRTTYTFKGDANRGPDTSPVVPGQIRGRMWFHVPYLGTVRTDLKSRALQVLILTIVLGGYAISQLAAGFRERRKEIEHVRA